MPPLIESFPVPPRIVSRPDSPRRLSSAEPPLIVSSSTPPSTRSRPLPPLSVSRPEPPWIESSPSSPETRSLPSSPDILSLPRPPARLSTPAPPERSSSPPSPLQESFPLPPSMRSSPPRPRIVSLPSLPRIVSLPSPASTESLPLPTSMVKLIRAPFGARMPRPIDTLSFPPNVSMTTAETWVKTASFLTPSTPRTTTLPASRPLETLITSARSVPWSVSTPVPTSNVAESIARDSSDSQARRSVVRRMRRRPLPSEGAAGARPRNRSNSERGLRAMGRSPAGRAWLWMTGATKQASHWCGIPPS